MSRLQLESVSYVLAGRTVLDGVTAEVPPQAITGLIGPNGAGKSTLLRIMAGLRRPTHGRVLLDGTDVHRLPDRLRARRIAMLPQNPQPPSGFTVEQVVAMGRHPFLRRLEPMDAASHQIVADAMRATDTYHLRERRIDRLSGGEQQRVFLARALAQQPSLLLLDEPTANLDVRYQLEFFQLLLKLRAERALTVVIALHDLTWALRYCDHVLVLHGGRSVAQGAPADVIDSELIGRVFGVKAHVVRAPHGRSVDIVSL